jgi:hypothetical protein
MITPLIVRKLRGGQFIRTAQMHRNIAIAFCQ